MKNFLAGFILSQALTVAGWFGYQNYKNAVTFAAEKSAQYDDIEIIEKSHQYFNSNCYEYMCATVKGEKVLFHDVRCDHYTHNHSTNKGKIVFNTNWCGQISKKFVPHDIPYTEE